MLPCKSSENPSNPTYSETPEQTRLSYDIFDPTNNTFLKAHRAGRPLYLVDLWSCKKIEKNKRGFSLLEFHRQLLLLSYWKVNHRPTDSLPIFHHCFPLSPLVLYFVFFFSIKKHTHNAFSQNHCQSLQHIVWQLFVFKNEMEKVWITMKSSTMMRDWMQMRTAPHYLKCQIWNCNVNAPHLHLTLPIPFSP